MEGGAAGERVVGWEAVGGGGGGGRVRRGEERGVGAPRRGEGVGGRGAAMRGGGGVQGDGRGGGVLVAVGALWVRCNTGLAF